MLVYSSPLGSYLARLTVYISLRERRAFDALQQCSGKDQRHFPHTLRPAGRHVAPCATLHLAPRQARAYVHHSQLSPETTVQASFSTTVLLLN